MQSRRFKDLSELSDKKYYLKGSDFERTVKKEDMEYLKLFKSIDSRLFDSYYAHAEYEVKLKTGEVAYLFDIEKIKVA